MQFIVTRANKKVMPFKWTRIWHIFRIQKRLHKLNPAIVFEFSLSRLLACIAVLIVSTYMLAALGLYAWRTTVPENKISFLDIALPIRWGNIPELQGQTNIAQAKADMKKEHHREAFFKFRAGLARYPQDQSARLEMAKLLMASGLYEVATKTLTEGLKYGYPKDPEYISTLFQLINFRQNNPEILNLIPQLLEFEEIQSDPEQKYKLLQDLVHAQMTQNDWFALLKTTEELENDPDAPFKVYNIKAYTLLQMATPEQALEYVQQLPEDVKNNIDFLLLEAIIYQRLDQTENMMAKLNIIFKQYPEAWKAQIDAIELIEAAGRSSESLAYLELYINLHWRNTEAINALLVRLTDTPDSAKLIFSAKLLEKLRPDLKDSIQFFIIQSYITEGEWKKASELFAQWNEKYKNDTYSEQNQRYSQVFGALLQAAKSQSKGDYQALINILSQNRQEPEMYWESAEAMRKLGANETAIEIINLANNHYPFNQSLETLRERILENQ